MPRCGWKACGLSASASVSASVASSAATTTPEARAPSQRRLDLLFARIAHGYDLQLPLERRALSVGARLAEPLEGARTLDVGSGTGAFAQALLARGAASVVATDRSAAMLKRAARRLTDAGPRARVVRADGRRLPFGDACFDVITIGYLLHLLRPPSALAVLAEARRVLRPGGRLVVVVHSAPAGRLGWIYRAGWGLAARALPGVVGGTGPIGDARPLLEAGGFAVTAERRVALGYWSQVVLARAAA